jgi:hypothetical protein
MANRVFTISKRSDADGMGIYFDDLHPNGSQKSSTYDGEGASHYLRWFSKDAAAHTAALFDVGDGDALDPVVADTTGGGNDVTVSAASVTRGLLAYLRDRVHVNPGGADRFMTKAEALAVAGDIWARVIAGGSLTLAVVNGFLNARCAGADNDLEGTNGTSFGSVEDILRILSGEVYAVPANTIQGDQAGAWLGLVARGVLVAAASAFTPVAQGSFVADRPVPVLTRNGSINISAGEGKLSGFGAATFGFTNPNHAYSAGAVTALVPRAVFLDGSNIPSTGVGSAVGVYDSTGAVLV